MGAIDLGVLAGNLLSFEEDPSDTNKYIQVPVYKAAGILLISDYRTHYQLTPTPDTVLSDGVISPVQLEVKLPWVEVEDIADFGVGVIDCMAHLFSKFGERRHFRRNSIVAVERAVVGINDRAILGGHPTRPLDSAQISFLEYDGSASVYHNAF